MQYDKLLNLGTDLGRHLMTCGAEIYRVEESVHRLLTAYGLEPQVFAIPTCLIVSVVPPNGQPLTRMCRIPAHGTDIEGMERFNDLCRRLCQNPIPVEDAHRQLDQLAARIPHHTPKTILFGYAVTTCFFSLFFGGSFLDCLCAALCGLIVGLCLLYGRRLTGSNTFFRTAVCAAVAASTALLLVWLGFGQSVDAITIGTLMVLVPGMALTNAMREIMAGDVISGLTRTAEVILIAAAIALGTAIPMLFSSLL